MTKEKNMKKACLRIAIVALLCLHASLMHAQDQAAGEKLFKAKCAGCHGADAAGKAATKAPSVKGKSADEITKHIATSPKHATLKKLTPDEIKSIADYLAALR
jgi:mono/diheme cytochrome c family protein